MMVTMVAMSVTHPKIKYIKRNAYRFSFKGVIQDSKG